MPKPTPRELFVCVRIFAIIASTSFVSMFAAPVTPLSET
jgi:hypothetical protein